VGIAERSYGFFLIEIVWEGQHECVREPGHRAAMVRRGC
jgi:hypothetical protein